MSYRTLLLEADPNTGVTELRLNRPGLLNRFDADLLAELGPAMRELEADESVRAVVWTSTGKQFSAGGDFEEILAGHRDPAHLEAGIARGKELYRTFAGFSKPLVVALHGNTFGVATSLVLLGDAIVTHPDVRIADPHVHIGLVAGDGGAISWPMNLSLVRAKRHLLWGEAITGAEAYELGMVTDMTSSDFRDIQQRAFDLAEAVAALPPVAVQLTKKTLNAGLAKRVDELLDVGFANEAISNRTDDVVEAVNSFKEKRPGRWSGK